MGTDNQEFLEATLPYLDVIYRVARNVCRDRDLADDLVQETYLRAFSAFGRQQIFNTKSWLVTICLNLARSEARRASRRFSEVPLGEADDVYADQASVLDEVLIEIDREVVARALARLPGDQKMAIVLMDLANLSASEAGAVLECPRNTVLSRVHRGRQRLARYLIEEKIDRS